MKSYDLVHELTNTAAVFGRNKDVSLVFEGDGAATDGQEIQLPALSQGMELSQDDVMVFRGYLDHEAGHVRHTNFDNLQAFAKTCSQEARHIHNCLEDIWLEHRVMDEYPGAEKNLRKLSEMIVDKFEKPAVLEKPDHYKSVNVNSVCNAILRTGRLEYGGDGNAELYDMQPSQFKAWGEKWKELTLKAQSTKELINLALEIEKLIDSTPPEENMEEPQSGEGLGGNPADFDFDPDGDITRGKGAKKAKEGKAPAKIEVGNKDKFFKEWVQSKEDELIKNDKTGVGEYKVFSTRWDEVYEVGKPAKDKSHVHNTMEKTPSSEYEKRKAKLGGVVNTMKARLRRALLAKETRDWDFGRELGRLDSKRLVAGVLGAPNIYKMRKDRYEMDTAVHFLVDLSGSMGGEKIKVACDSVIALSECLEGTPIKYQVTGFSNYNTPNNLYEKLYASKGRYNRVEPLKLHKFKAFEKSLQVSKGSIAAIAESSGGNNSDRDAVIWAYQQLKKRPEKRKILFVLSDGQPANTQHGPKQLNLEKCLKEAIDDCTKAGVECVGIGIRDRTVLGIYPKAVSITSVNDLSGAIFTQLSNLLTGGKVMF
jgi:cobalamin biosynthesis protein CobT